MPDRSVLVVEDNPAISTAIQASLSRIGCRIRAAGTCKTGLALALEMVPAVLILDIGLPDDTGWSLLYRLREARPDTRPPVIVISAYRVTRGQLGEYGVHRFVPNPFDMADLVNTVEEFLGAGQGDDATGRKPVGAIGAKDRTETGV